MDGSNGKNIASYGDFDYLLFEKTANKRNFNERYVVIRIHRNDHENSAVIARCGERDDAISAAKKDKALLEEMEKQKKELPTKDIELEKKEELPREEIKRGTGQEKPKSVGQNRRVDSQMVVSTKGNHGIPRTIRTKHKSKEEPKPHTKPTSLTPLQLGHKLTIEDIARYSRHDIVKKDVDEAAKRR